MNQNDDSKAVLNEMANLYNTWDDDCREELEDFDTDEFFSACNYDDFPDNFPVEQVEQDGGGEGNGEDCMCVIKYKEKFYRFEYRYASYAGHVYDVAPDTFREVFPKEKVITVYE